MTKEYAIGLACAIGFLFLWATWIVLSRMSVTQDDLLASDVVMLRFAIAGLLVSPLIMKYWPRHLNIKQIFIIACGIGAPYSLPTISGLNYTSAGHAGVFINGMIPLITASLAWVLYRQKINIYCIIALFLVLIGCIGIGWQSLMTTYLDTDGLMQLYGIGLILCGTSVISFYIVFSSHLNVKPIEAVIVMGFVNGVVFSLIWLIFLPTNITQDNFSIALSHGAFQAIGPSLIGLFCFQTAIRNIGKMTTSLIASFVPAVAAMLSIFILDETLDIYSVFGIAIVIIGVIIYNKNNINEAPKP